MAVRTDRLHCYRLERFVSSIVVWLLINFIGVVSAKFILTPISISYMVDKLIQLKLVFFLLFRKYYCKNYPNMTYAKYWSIFAKCYSMELPLPGSISA